MFSREISLLAAPSGHRNGALPFQESDHRSDRMLWGYLDTPRHMIWHQVPFNNLPLLLPGQGMEDFPQLTTRLPEQHFAPSLGDKHHMVFAVPSRMG
jgi:hypothetical protein